ncbi:MAG: hypothetical protein QOE90_2244 [Thermoplasmata archaeon]|jgi:hypothetical protein|nr:hypothetical protein [Thermoplasmata archaeon]
MFAEETAPPSDLAAPEDLVRRYVELTRKRRDLDDQLAYLRAELELVAASALTRDSPRGRFRAGEASVLARLQPSCVFDKAHVARELQKAGRLADVATLTGPQLARFLASEPALAARLSDHVRMRNAVVLMASQD